MDILRPSLLWIGGRCYRLNTAAEKGHGTSRFETHETESRPKKVENVCIATDEPCDVDCTVEEKNGKFTVAIELPSALNGSVLGQRGVTRTRIESETNTKIIVPKLGVEGQPVLVRGNTRASVLKARSRILQITESARLRHPPTHFLSIPLGGSTMLDNLQLYKEEVLKQCQGERGVNAGLFQNPKKFHLTIGVLTLLNESERQKANDLLLECVDKIIRPIVGDTPLVVDVKGIKYMNDDPAEINVVYANVEVQQKPERLQLLADKLVDHFVDAGIMTKQYDNVKIHATLMNTQFANSEDEMGKPKVSSYSRSKKSFDGRQLLKQFKDFDFGCCNLHTLHLSQRYTTGKDGYYLPSRKLPLL